MPFEIIFITEGMASTPAAEIQFDGQRACVVRLTADGVGKISLAEDKYLDKPFEQTLVWSDFQSVIQEAFAELAGWQDQVAQSSG